MEVKRKRETKEKEEEEKRKEEGGLKGVENEKRVERSRRRKNERKKKAWMQQNLTLQIVHRNQLNFERDRKLGLLCTSKITILEVSNTSGSRCKEPKWDCGRQVLQKVCVLGTTRHLS